MSRSEFDVCLILISESVTLAELTGRIGAPPSDGSHSMGDPHILKSRGKWTSTMWQGCSDCPRSTPVEAQFKEIARRFPAEPLQALLRSSVLSKTYISVALFTDAQTPTVELTSVCMTIANAYGASIEIRVYTPDMGDSDA